MHDLVTVQNGKPTTTSRIIAETFDKEHQTVLRDIRAIVKNPNLDGEFSRYNFVQSEYRSSRGKQYPEYIITKDGFTLLVMGYTGAKAMQYKVKYIEAFNKMESVLKGQTAQSDTNALLMQIITLLTAQNAPQMPQITTIGQYAPPAPVTPVQAQNEPTKPRMRTRDKCIEMLKQDEPGTNFTRNALERLIKNDEIRYVTIGNKILVNYDKLIEYLNTGITPAADVLEVANSHSGAVRRIEI